MSLLRAHNRLTTPRNNERTRRTFLPLAVSQRTRGRITLLLIADSNPSEWLPRSVLGQVLEALRVTVTTDYDAHYDLAFAWSLPLKAAHRNAARNVPIINDTHFDCAKANLSASHQSVFGYNADVDPLTHVGPCVAKSDSQNGVHDGRIVCCPVARKEPDKVYQAIIHNELNERFVEDIRVPIVGTEVPFVYLKYRPIKSRFSNENAYVMLTSACQVFTDEEVHLITRLAEEIGLEYGELDVLRDRLSGRLFVVDANNTPFGPPNHISPDERHMAVILLAEAFHRQFVKLAMRAQDMSESLTNP